jgi:transcription elongation factor
LGLLLVVATDGAGPWPEVPKSSVEFTAGCAGFAAGCAGFAAGFTGSCTGAMEGTAGPKSCVVLAFACAGGAAVKTWLHREHCTGTPPGGSSLGSSAYCMEHWGQAICTVSAYHTPPGRGAYRSSIVA